MVVQFEHNARRLGGARSNIHYRIPRSGLREEQGTRNPTTQTELTSNPKNGCLMLREKREMAALYLELASICFNEAAKVEDADTAEALRRMSRHYLVQAVDLNRALADQ